MFIRDPDQGLIERTENRAEVSCGVDPNSDDPTVGKVSLDIQCGGKIHLMTHLGESLEYVPQQRSVIATVIHTDTGEEEEERVIKAETIYSAFRAVVSDLLDRVDFLDQKIFRYMSDSLVFLQTNLMVTPDENGSMNIYIDLTNKTFVVDGIDVVIKHTEVLDEGQCGGFTEVMNKGTYNWQSASSSADQSLPCQYNVTRTAVAKCICQPLTGLCVLNTTSAYGDCPFKSDKTNKLDDLNKRNESATVKAEQLKDLTEDMTEENIDVDGYDIGANTISDILEEDVDYASVEEVNANVLEVIDKFANAKSVVAYKEPVATEKYLRALDKVLLNTKSTGDNSKEIQKSNMKMALLDVPKNEDTDLTLSCSSGSNGEGVNIKSDGSSAFSKDQEIVMNIPKNIRKSLPDNNKFYFVVFDKPTFFTTQELFTGERKLQSKVFSAGVAGIDNIRGINPPIEFKMRTLNRSAVNRSECVYWRDTGNGVRDREIIKVKTLQSTRDVIHCQTDHLTSFAILMSSDPLPEIHEKILGVISYLGCSLSIIGLILSLVGLSVFRVIRKPVATKVHINMSAALLLANVTFMVGIDETESPTLCLVCGILCHYFFLAAILWMGIEGFHLYVMIVRVFGHLSNRFLLKCAIFAWGFPAVMVGVTLGWNVDHYETKKFCWLRQIPMVCSFMVPVMIVISINSYMFIRVTQEITKSQARKSENMPASQHPQNHGMNDIRDKLAKVRASVSVMVLLGLAWILGPIMLLDMLPGLTTPIAYLFTACNSLQGFLFFFFHCAIKTDVKERWKTYLGLELSHSQISDFSKTYNKNSKPLTNQKTTDFSKLGDSTSLNKSLLSFKPKNKVKPGRPGSPEDDSELAIVDF